jgi:hypothetical protein
MVQRGQDLGFAMEAREAIGIRGDGCRQQLDGDLPFQPRVGGAIDLAHAALAEQGGHFVRTQASARRDRHRPGGGCPRASI